jgi:hypothetical protein
MPVPERPPRTSIFDKLVDGGNKKEDLSHNISNNSSEDQGSNMNASLKNALMKMM